MRPHHRKFITACRVALIWYQFSGTRLKVAVILEEL
jgi:hypothetical protein